MGSHVSICFLWAPSQMDMWNKTNRFQKSSIWHVRLCLGVSTITAEIYSVILWFKWREFLKQAVEEHQKIKKNLPTRIPRDQSHQALPVIMTGSILRRSRGQTLLLDQSRFHPEGLKLWDTFNVSLGGGRKKKLQLISVTWLWHFTQGVRRRKILQKVFHPLPLPSPTSPFEPCQSCVFGGEN